MRKGAIFAAGLALWALAGPAHAEQPMADEYRRIFHSGSFYVEYKDNYTVRIIGEKDASRMERTRYESSLRWMASLNPLGMLFGSREPSNPEVMHRDGKYYQFLEEDRAIVCEDGMLDAENLNPREGWNGVAAKLALPVELAVFFWDDPYRPKTRALEEPSLRWSGKLQDGGTEYDCDRYESRILSAAGGEDATYVCEMLYEGGKLKKIRSFVRKDGESYPVNEFSVKAISGDVPESLFRIKKNTKVYAAGTGDMDDLLQSPAEVGRLEGR